MQAELQGVLTARDSTSDEIKQARNLLKYDMPVLLESYDNLINSLSGSVEGARDQRVPKLTAPGRVSEDAEDFQKILQGPE